MAEACGETEEALGRDGQPASPAASMESDSYSDTPTALQPGSQTQVTGLRETGTDAELWALLKALPTKTDIESLIGRIEQQHRQEMREVKGEMKSLSPGSRREKPRWRTWNGESLISNIYKMPI